MEAVIGIIIVMVIAFLVIVKVRAKKSPHSQAKMLRFANSSATDVLSSNWDHEEYFSRMYRYASQELASHMYKNKSLLNKVLDERAALLGNFVEIKGMELHSPRFNLLPQHIFEASGVLHCSNGNVPIIILVNAAKDELSLDGIKIRKEHVKILPPSQN